MSGQSDSEVLVVGAGPVGLIAALFLEQYGVPVTIVDAHQRTTQQSYALAIHPHTLRTLDESGLSGALIAAGRKLTKVAYYEAETRRAEIDLSRLAGPHPYLLIVRQSVLEKTVEKALRAKGRHVLWNHRLEGVNVDNGTVRADVATLDQDSVGYPVATSEWVVTRTEMMRPTWIIGADGCESTVRRLAGIDMAHWRAGQIFSIFEIEASGELPDEVRVTFDRELTCVYWPLENGRCRFGFQIADASEHEPSMTRLQHWITTRAPWCTAQPTQIYWSTLAAFPSRLVRTLRAGAVWLAGDAAHLASPIGVQSMNAGISEARELAWRMAEIQRGSAAPSVLHEFETETLKKWERLLGDGGPVRALPGAAPWVQQNADRILACLPASEADVEPLLRQIHLDAKAS